MLTYMDDGEFLDRQLSNELTLQAVTYNPSLRCFGYAKATFTWGGDGFIKMKVWAMGLPAIDYSGYINSRQYGMFVPDWFVVVLAVLYILMMLVDIVRSSFHQAKIKDEHGTPSAAIQLTTGEYDCASSYSRGSCHPRNYI